MKLRNIRLERKMEKLIDIAEFLYRKEIQKTNPDKFVTKYTKQMVSQLVELKLQIFYH